MLEKTYPKGLLTGLLVLLMTMGLKAQVIHNEGTLYLESGTPVYFGSDFTNEAGATLENNGTISVDGNWTNDATYTPGTGEVQFTSGVLQTIDGTSATTFYNLTIDKSANGVSLNRNTLVSNQLDLTDDFLDLNSNQLTITTGATTGITRTTGFVLSEDTDNSSVVQWNMGTTTGAHEIPFGTSAGVEIPLTINVVSGNVGNVTTATYPTAADNTPFPTAPTNINNVNNVNTGLNNSANTVNRFWQIDETGGTGVTTITFTYANAEAPTNGETNLRAQRWIDASSLPTWQAPFASQVANAATNTVTASNVSDFTAFALAQDANPLPIELLSFEARLVGEVVELTWTTATEINNDFFTVEKTLDGVDFVEVGQTDGAGNSNRILHYDDIDAAPYKGLSYYRLKQTDYDGTVSYSDLRPIEIKPKETNLKLLVYPNPAHQWVKVELSGWEEPYLTEVYSAMGNLVLQETLSPVQNQLQLSALAEGTYLIRVYANDEVLTRRLVKVR